VNANVGGLSGTAAGNAPSPRPTSARYPRRPSGISSVAAPSFSIVSSIQCFVEAGSFREHDLTTGESLRLTRAPASSSTVRLRQRTLA
jgi:hypothetical protein